jgi:two-component system NtrC family sensor kinase
MSDENKTKEQLVAELLEMHEQIAELEKEKAERKRAEGAIRRRNEELAALNEIGQAIGSTLNLTQVLKLVAQKTAQVCNVERCSILLLDQERKDLVPMMSQFASGDTDIELWRIFKEETYADKIDDVPAAREVIRERRTVILDKESKSHLPPRWTEPFGIKSLLMVPLVSKDETIGLLALDYTAEGHSFSAEQVDLATTVGSQVAIAIENARSYEAARRRVTELTALREVSLQVARSLDLSRVLDTIAKSAVELVKASDAHIFLYDEEKGEFTFGTGVWRSDEEGQVFTQVRKDGLTATVARRGEPVVINEARTHPLYSDEASQEWGMEAIAGLPLKRADRVSGVFNVAFLEPHTFDEDELRLLTLLADQAAIAIENARLHEETQRRVEELSAIEEIVHELSSTLDFQKVIQLLLDKAIEATDASAGAIAVLTQERSMLLLLAHQGYPVHTDANEPWRWSIERGIVGRVAKTGELSLVGDVSQDPDYAKVIPKTRSQLTVPIVREDKVAGTIVLESPQRGGFSEEQAGFVQHLAEHAALAMENAKLYERMRESEERYRTYVENVPDAIWETDVEGHFTYWSPQVENLTGYASEELLGHTAYEFLMHADDVERSRDRTWQMVEEGRERLTLTYQALHRDGSVLHIETSIIPVQDDAGEVIKFQGVARDVSERVRLQAQLIQSAKLLAIGQMISGVAHELNNPLTTVMGYAQLLQMSDVDESVKEDLQTIYHDALRAQRIVQNLLTFARQKKPQRSSVDINEVIERTLPLADYQLKVENVEVVTELAENLPWTMADDYQLQQVFLNIINNARQAMAEHKDGGTLTVRTELLEDDIIRASFTDTGPGISSEVLDRIFDPFFTTREVGAGTGLGLSVSHGIIQEHDGRIWVETTPGHGATFFVELPVRSWLEEIAMPSSDEELEQVPSEGRRILVIDDERSIVNLIVRVLRESGYHVDGVTSAEVALKTLRRKRYDLIISDVKMPDMDGPACEREVRAMDPGLAERIIFITGDLLSPTTQTFLEGWEGRFIKKPFGVEELRAVVAEALG